MKRLLSSFLVIALVVLSVPVYAFIPQGNVKYSPDVVELNQDFEGQLSDFTTGTTVEDESYGQAEVTGGKLKVSNPQFNLGSNLDLGKNKTKYILQFSVSTEEDYKTTDTLGKNYSLYWYAPGRGANNSGYGITIPFESISGGVVRTYQLTINESATTATSVFEKVLVKDGDGEYRKLGVTFNAEKLPSTNCHAEFSPKYLNASEYKFYLGGKTFAGGSLIGWNAPYEKAPVFFFDGIKVNTYKLVEGNGLNVNNLSGISYSENFDNIDDFTQSNVSVTQNSEKNGNSYYTIKPTGDENTAVSNLHESTPNLLQPNTTITLDLKCETEGAPFLISVGKPSAFQTINEEKSISYGTTVYATFSISSSSEKVNKVEFYVNGQLHTTDTAAVFEAEFSDLKIGTNTILTKAYCQSGLILQSEPKYIKVNYVEGKAFDIGQEYEVDYKYVEGDGILNINDGYFNLSVSHNGDALSYQTADGNESYQGIGAGDYKIVVASGHAEIYWNGQFLKSILLPYSQAQADVSHSSLKDLKVKSSGVKATLLNVENGSSFENDAFPKTQYYALEFDKKNSSNEEIYLNDGVYSTNLYFRNDGIYAKRQLTAGVAASEQKLSDSVETGYYRLTVGLGIAQLSCNNKTIGNFRMVLGGGKPKIKRTVTNTSSSSFMALKNTDDVYYHSDNFENDAELSYEEYWQAGPINYRTAASEGGVTAELETESGNNYMSLKGTGVYVLNATDQHPNMKWRGKVDGASGKVFAILRQSLAQQHTKIGYDFDNQKWFFEIMRLDGTIVEADSKAASGALQAGKWYDFEVKTDGFTVTLIVDNTKVFETEIGESLKSGAKLELIPYGRFGVGVSNSEYSIDDFVYKGENRVTPGAKTFVPLQFAGEDVESDNAFPAVSDVDSFFKDGTAIYGVTGANTAIKSLDNGNSWEKSSNPFGSVNDYVYMPDGTIVSLVRGNASLNTRQYSRISKDGGKTWSASYRIHDGTDGYIGTGERLRCTKDGRIFGVFSSGYEHFTRLSVYYSDDGMSWTKSDTEFVHYDTKIVADEAIVVDTPRENEVWMYFRSNTGFVTYYKSFDNGKTFDKTPHFSGLMQTASTYSIKRDWDNPNTYYAAFMYDTDTADASGGTPRNRSALAVSYDGMETWEYVSDLIVTDNIPYLPMSDLNMYHLNGHLYWKIDSLQGPGRRHIGVQDISTIKPLKRFPQLHFRYFIDYEYIEEAMQRQCVVSKSKGISWIYGDYYVSDVKGGYIDPATVARIFGVTSSTSGSKVTLSLGGKAVAELTPDSNGYLNLENICTALGIVLIETDNAYCVMSGAALVDMYQDAIDNLV